MSFEANLRLLEERLKLVREFAKRKDVPSEVQAAVKAAAATLTPVSKLNLREALERKERPL